MNVPHLFTDFRTDYRKNQVVAVFNCFQIGNPAKVPDHGNREKSLDRAGLVEHEDYEVFLVVDYEQTYYNRTTSELIAPEILVQFISETVPVSHVIGSDVFVKTRDRVFEASIPT